MPRRVVRGGQGLALITLLLVASVPVRAADPSSPAASGSPAVPASSTVPGPVVPHGAPRLEALLPAEIDGVPLFRTSFGPATWAIYGAGAFEPLTEEFGVDIDAISIAAANDPTAASPFNVFVMAVAGVAGATVTEVYARLAQQIEVGSTLGSATLGSIAVTHLDAPSNFIPNIWVWAVDDVMFGIQAADAVTAARLIALLPTSVPTPDPMASPSAAP